MNNTTDISVNDTLFDPQLVDPIGAAPWMPEILFYIFRGIFTVLTGWIAIWSTTSGGLTAEDLHTFSGWTYQGSFVAFWFGWIHLAVRELRGSIPVPAWCLDTIANMAVFFEQSGIVMSLFGGFIYWVFLHGEGSSTMNALAHAFPAATTLLNFAFSRMRF